MYERLLSSCSALKCAFSVCNIDIRTVPLYSPVQITLVVLCLFAGCAISLSLVTFQMRSYTRYGECSI